MTYKFEQQIKEHSLESVPSEACGWIVKSATDALECVRSLNTAPDTLNDFKVETERHLALLKSGLLVAYYHSHDNSSNSELLSDFSTADKAFSEETGLPVYLYLVKEDRILCYVPKGMRFPLENRPYIPRVFDCYRTPKHYFEHIGISTPDFDFSLEQALSGITGSATKMKEAGFVPVLDLKPKDLLIMHYKCRRPNHLGVYLGDGHFLHHLYNMRSKVEVYGDFWKNCTSHICRHESLF